MSLPRPQDPLELDRPVESRGYARLATVEDEGQLLVAAAAMFTERWASTRLPDTVMVTAPACTG